MTVFGVLSSTPTIKSERSLHFSPLLGLGHTCDPILLDRSTVFLKTMAILPIVTLVWPAMLLAEHTMFVSPAHLFGFLGDARVH